VSHWRAYLLIVAMSVLSSAHGPAAAAQDTPRYDRTSYSQAVTLCDKLAAYPPDRDRVSPGLDRDLIDISQAIVACEADVKADPANPRLRYQLARLYGYQKNKDQVAIHRQVALAASYPIAVFVAGYERAFASGEKNDVCAGAALMLQAARAGAYAAQVGLTAYTVSGVFKACRDAPTPAEMKNFLAAATPRAEGHFETLLIESLLRDVSALR